MVLLRKGSRSHHLRRAPQKLNIVTNHSTTKVSSLLCHDFTNVASCSLTFMTKCAEEPFSVSGHSITKHFQSLLFQPLFDFHNLHERYVLLCTQSVNTLQTQRRII